MNLINNILGCFAASGYSYSEDSQEIKDSYSDFEVPYNGKDNDDYVNGQGFCCDDNVGLRAGNDNPELFQYYYHSDHLGSTSLITNIEARNNNWNTPYLFNAKELDDETGLYYYGARYYDARVSLWLGTDPMQERYPNVSTYAYCSNNPVKFVDRDGMDIQIYYISEYARGGREIWKSWTFNGTNQTDAPSNQFVQDFLAEYNYNIGNGGGENMYKLANNKNITGKIRSNIINKHENDVVYWDSKHASTTKEGYVRSPATNLEHEIDHLLDYLTQPDAHTKRADIRDAQYDSKEERRVITGSEAKTAQANGEYPKGYTRGDHDEYDYIRVSNPTKTTPISANPIQKQTVSTTWLDSFIQWFKNL